MKKAVDTKEQRNIIFEIIDQRPSNFVLDDPEENGGELSGTLGKISTCDRRLLSSSSIDVKDPKTGLWRPRKTRYIRGCDSIFVDEQERDKISPTPDDNIWLKAGRLVVQEGGIDLSLFKYLTEGYNGNRDMRVSDKVRRPQAAEDEIYEIDTVVNSEKDIEFIDAQYKAQKFVQGLKVSEGGKLVYNEDSINFIAKVLRLPNFGGIYSEAWLSIHQFAVENPKDFVDKVGDSRALIESDVAEAKQKGVIVFDNQKVYFANTKAIIKKFADSTSELEKFELIVSYFSNPDNADEYNLLRTGIRAATNAVLGPVE